MPHSMKHGDRAAFPMVAEYLDMPRHSGDDTGAPLRRALWLAEDLAALGSKRDGFDFESFGLLVERARDVLRLAKGREGEL